MHSTLNAMPFAYMTTVTIGELYAIRHNIGITLQRTPAATVESIEPRFATIDSRGRVPNAPVGVITDSGGYGRSAIVLVHMQPVRRPPADVYRRGRTCAVMARLGSWRG